MQPTSSFKRIGFNRIATIFMPALDRQVAALPLFNGKVSTGFPSPADELR